MLSDIFGSFEIDDAEDETVIEFCTPEKYEAEIHSEGWFLEKKDTDKECLLHAATYAYSRGEYQSAIKMYETHLEAGPHNRGHLASTYDSIVRCATKIPNFPSDTLRTYLTKYESFATDYGDQLQFWDAVIKALLNINEDWATEKYLTTVSMLCATIDLPEHWLAFGENPFLKAGPNFHLAYLVRASALAARHLATAEGFAAEVIQKRQNSIKKRLDSLEITEEQLNEARRCMTVDLMSQDDRQLLTGDTKRPAHECRSKIGEYKNPEKVASIVQEFRNRFAWMFEKM